MKQKLASAKPHSSQEASLRSCVQSIVAIIPSGRVMTYGQIAALCGSPRAARVVGGIAHYGNTKLPWHRVVNKNGGLARGYPGGMRTHAEHLRGEGVSILDGYRIYLPEYIWTPPYAVDEGNHTAS